MTAHLCARAAAAAVPSCSSIRHSGSGKIGADSKQPRPLRRSQWVAVPSDRDCACSRGSLTAAATQKEREAAPSGSEPKGAEHEPQQGGIFQNLASSLLRGAASRLDRGPTTCLKCRGTGTVTCTACKGHGVLEKSQVRMKTAGRVSNRCSKCAGSGRTTCTTCKGRGFRGDFFEE